MKNQLYSVYRITNIIDEKIYVGYSSDVEKRWKNHIKIALFSKRKQKLHHAMAKYGIENFKFEILETNIETKEIACDIEKRYIELFQTYLDDNKGYNQTPGGEGGPTFKGRKHSDEYKIRMSKIQQNRSEEWKKNLSKSQKNRSPISESSKEKMRIAWKKRKLENNIISPEGRRKISQANLGKQCSIKTKNAVSDF